MTIGAFALLALDTDPIRPTEAHIAALADANSGASAAIARLDVPLSPVRWRSIVIHSNPNPRLGDQFHFIIEQGGKDPIKATPLWNAQRDGRHTMLGDFATDSIGICLKGDFSTQPPTAEQFEALVSLVRGLQHKLRLYPEQVLLHREIDGSSSSPGAAFPAAAFSQHLLRRLP